LLEAVELEFCSGRAVLAGIQDCGLIADLSRVLEKAMKVGDIIGF
jgi:hypothetical protein